MSNLLNKKSGVLGISGKYSDDRDLTKACAEGDERAILARDMQFYQIRKCIGSYIAALDGIDAIVLPAVSAKMLPTFARTSSHPHELLRREDRRSFQQNRMARHGGANLHSPIPRLTFGLFPPTRSLLSQEIPRKSLTNFNQRRGNKC